MSGTGQSPTDPPLRLGNRLRYVRETYRRTRAELATETGVTEEVIARLEEDPDYLPETRDMLQICRRFSMDLGRMFWVAEAPPVAWAERAISQREG